MHFEESMADCDVWIRPAVVADGFEYYKMIVELGGIDIYHEISILSKHQAMPRENHLEALYHVFA
jgi:hypothetical protein